MIKPKPGNLFQNRNQIWTFYAQLARILSGLAFIGLLARSLSSELLGTWYIFVSLFGVAGLVEMGLAQVIGRHAAYLKADYELGRISSTDFLKFAQVGERFYLFLASLIGLIAFPVGMWWLSLDEIQSGMHAPMAVAWLVYVMGGALAILGSYYAALVNGAGQMWQAQRAAIFAAGMSIAVLLTLLVLPGALLIPATAMLLSQLLLVVLLRRAYQNLSITKAALLSSQSAEINSYVAIQVMVKDAVKMFVIMVSYQLLTNGFVLILSKYFKMEVIASYGLTMQIVGVVLTFSMVWSHSNFFEMAAARQSGDFLRLRQLFFGAFTRAGVVSFIGLFAIFLVAPPILALWGSKTDLLQPVSLAIILGVLWVEFGLGQVAQMLIAVGDMRVAYFSLVAAVAICIFSVLLLSHGYGLVELFAARILVYGCVMGIPVLLMSNKALTVESVSDEAL